MKYYAVMPSYVAGNYNFILGEALSIIKDWLPFTKVKAIVGPRNNVEYLKVWCSSTKWRLIKIILILKLGINMFDFREDELF